MSIAVAQIVMMGGVLHVLKKLASLVGAVVIFKKIQNGNG